MSPELSPLAAATAALAGQQPPAPLADDPAAPPVPPIDPPEGETPPPEGEGETPPVEGETPPVEGETPPAEGETPPAEGETPPVEGEPSAPIEIAIPGRFPNQPLTLVVDSQEAQESVQRLVNGYMRGEQARETMARAQDELTRASEERLAFVADPVGVLERASPDVRAMIVRNLLLDEAVRQQVDQDLAALSTEGVAALEDRATRQRLELKEQARGQVAEIREREKFAASLDRMFSEALDRTGMPDERKDAVYDLMLTALESHETRTGKRLRSLEEARAVLAPTVAALQFSFDAPPAAPPAPVAGRPAPKAAPVPGAPAPARSVASLQRGQAARAASSAAASTGRGAPPIPPSAPLVAPAGATLAQATAHLRKMQGSAS